jgi:hypothetical protein
VKISEWDSGLSSRQADDLKEVLELVKDMKNPGGLLQELQSPGVFAGG